MKSGTTTNDLEEPFRQKRFDANCSRRKRIEKQKKRFRTTQQYKAKRENSFPTISTIIKKYIFLHFYHQLILKDLDPIFYMSYFLKIKKIKDLFQKKTKTKRFMLKRNTLRNNDNRKKDRVVFKGRPLFCLEEPESTPCFPKTCIKPTEFKPEKRRMSFIEFLKEEKNMTKKEWRKLSQSTNNKTNLDKSLSKSEMNQKKRKNFFKNFVKNIKRENEQKHFSCKNPVTRRFSIQEGVVGYADKRNLIDFELSELGLSDLQGTDIEPDKSLLLNTNRYRKRRSENNHTFKRKLNYQRLFSSNTAIF